MGKYMTFNPAAKELDVSAYMLRAMQKRGECPGFYSGTRWYCNVDMLREKLEAESRSAMGAGGEIAH